MPISNLMPGSLYRDQVGISLIPEPRLGIIALPDDGTKAMARLLLIASVFSFTARAEVVLWRDPADAHLLG